MQLLILGLNVRCMEARMIYQQVITQNSQQFTSSTDFETNAYGRLNTSMAHLREITTFLSK